MRFGEPKRRSRVPLILGLGFVGLGLFVALGTTSLRAGDPPRIEVSADLPAIGVETNITITVTEPKRGVEMVRVYFVQDKREVQLGETEGLVLPAYAVWEKSEQPTMKR